MNTNGILVLTESIISQGKRMIMPRAKTPTRSPFAGNGAKSIVASIIDPESQKPIHIEWLIPNGDKNHRHAVTIETWLDMTPHRKIHHYSISVDKGIRHEARDEAPSVQHELLKRYEITTLLNGKLLTFAINGVRCDLGEKAMELLAKRRLSEIKDHANDVIIRLGA